MRKRETKTESKATKRSNAPVADDRAEADEADETDETNNGSEEREADGGGDDGEVTEVVAEVVDVDELAAEEPADFEAPERPEGKTEALSRYDPMQAYLREVQRHALLTPEEEHALATRYFQNGDVNAAHRLVTANLRLVVKIAYEYRRAYKNIMDLVQEGNVGLMQAVKKYDPSRGVKLSSYAAWWIRAYILRYILNNWRMVKLGTTQAQRKLFFNLSKEKQRLLAMGIDPTPKEIANRLNVEEREVAEMDVRLGASEASLDAPVGDSDGRATSRIDLMPASSEGADELLAKAEISSKLRAKLETFRETLKGKELEIYELRLVAQDEPLTLQELGDRFGVSRERVRQLEARLVGKLRKHLGNELDAQSEEEED